MELTSSELDPFYTLQEIANRWKVSTDLIRKIFSVEAGVLVIQNPTSQRKRQYSTIRVPKAVLTRVETRRANAKRI